MTYLYQKKAFIQEVGLPSCIIDTGGVDVLPEEQREVIGER